MLRTTLFVGPSYQTLMTILRSRLTYFLMIGLGLLLGACFILEDQSLRDAPATFRKTPCVVVDSDVAIHGRNDWGAPTSFAPVVTFTFTAADGQTRTVSGYRLSEDGMSEAAAADVADRYEPGQQTTCYYDPANPDHAVMSLEAGGRRLGTLVFLSVLLLGGGLAGWVFLEYALKPVQPPPLPPPDALEAAPRLLAGSAAPLDGLQAEPPAPAWNEGFQGQV